MRRLKLILFAAALLIAIFTSATAQTSAVSTPANASPAVSDEQLIGRLVGEVEAGRELTTAQAEQIEALDRQLAAEKANSASLATSYGLAQKENDSLREANKLLTTAVALHEKTVEIVTADNTRLKGEAKKANKRAAVATLITVATIAARVVGF
jgi:Spy/CpxP family protein refolding chaperone